MTIKEFEIQEALGLLTYDMKWRMADNPNTPKETLKKLSTDKHWDVRCCVAKNPNTPPRIVVKLSTDKDRYVRWWADNIIALTKRS